MPKNHKEKARKKEILSQAKRKKKLQNFETLSVKQEMKVRQLSHKMAIRPRGILFVWKKIALHGGAWYANINGEEALRRFLRLVWALKK